MKTRKIVLAIFAGVIVASLFAFIGDNKSWIGTWEYTVKDASTDYQKGVMKLIDKDGKLTGKVITNNQTYPIVNLKMKSDTLTYVLDIDSTPVNVALVNLKDSISGTVITNQDNFILKGHRKKD